MHHRLAFVGFGNVARALARLLLRKQAVLKADYDITFSVTGIATGRHGFAAHPSGIDIEKALDLVESGKSIADSVRGATERFALRHPQQRGRCHVRELAGESRHGTAGAGPRARGAGSRDACHYGQQGHGGARLPGTDRAGADPRDGKFLFESTVLGGSPVFSVFRECMPAADLLSFRGVLNSTTNIILTRMERGETFDEAVRYCQSIGVAETDPSADVDGWDASHQGGSPRDGADEGAVHTAAGASGPAYAALRLR